MTSEELREKLNELVFKYAGGVRGDYVEADELLGLFEEYSATAIAEARKEDRAVAKGDFSFYKIMPYGKDGPFYCYEVRSVTLERVGDNGVMVFDRFGNKLRSWENMMFLSIVLTPKPNKPKEDL